MVAVEEDRSCLGRGDRGRESRLRVLTCLGIGRVREGSLRIGLRGCCFVAAVVAAGVDMRVEEEQKLVEK